MSKKRIFSGVQPSGRIHLGNYLGAIKQWVALQDKYEALYCVVDLHAITVSQDPETLRRKTLEAAKAYLALGVNPKKSHIFVQSQVPQHSELAWILNCITKNGDLTKMTQFKDKAGVNIDFIKENEDKIFELLKKTRSSVEYPDLFKSVLRGEKDINEITISGIEVFKTLEKLVELFKEQFNSSSMGLFDYPVLMAADIALYGTDVVPVGEDQEQHVELARVLTRRFNHKFGTVFTVPRSHISTAGARIMGLDDPTKKMSKSAKSEYNYIALDDNPELARKKIMRAVTDSEGTIAYDDNRPGVKNLVAIFSAIAGVAPKEIVARYEGKGYAEFKKDLAEIVAGLLADFQKKYAAIPDWKVRWILANGRRYATARAERTMRNVREKVGFLR